MTTPEDVLSFWLDEVGPKGWYQSSDALDQTIRDRFAETWNEAQKGALSLWLTYPSGALAYIILTDQFSRNMFRDSDQAFASDKAARAAAKAAIDRGYDMKIAEPARQFFYMPLSHSENLCDQDRGVRLVSTRLPETTGLLLHAQAHREIIRLFGRFPFRNEALGRVTTKVEAEFIKNGAYGAVVRSLQAQKAA